MNWYRNQKTMTKLLLGYFFISVIMAVVAYVGYSGMQTVSTAAAEMHDQNLRQIADLSQANDDLAGTQTHGMQAVLSLQIFKNNDIFTSESKNFTQVQNDFSQLLEKFQKEATDSARKDATDRLSAAWSDYKDTSARAVQLAASGKPDEATNLCHGEKGLGRFKVARLALSDLTKVNVDEAQQVRNQNEQTTQRSNLILFGVTFAGINLAIALGFLIARMIAGPLKKMTRSLQALAEDVSQMQVATSHIASGDLTASVSINTNELDIRTK
ncbi:MAG: MCP four helix bundle domain-containing protein, partial [Candidatus Marsarchaeota archaeon]|nr:MCP four helix bundle domain-containing protein [Candidatus Marsarchaeota archaeon]